MRDDEVKTQLARRSKNELIVIAKQLNIKHSGLRKEQLVDSIFSFNTPEQLRRILSLSWWQKYHNHVYGGVTIFSLILWAVSYYFPRATPTNSKQVAVSNREIINSNINLNQNRLMANTNSQNSEIKQANNNKSPSSISTPSLSIRPILKSIPQPLADQQNLVSVYLNSARSLYNKGEYQAAIAQCNKALSLDPNNSEAQNLKKSIQATVRILSPGHTK